MRKEFEIMTGQSKGNKSICLRVNVSKHQNAIIEQTMVLNGYKTKAQFIRECMLKNSPAMQRQLVIINQKLDQLLEKTKNDKE